MAKHTTRNVNVGDFKDDMPEPKGPKRSHRATYSRDKRKGGYLVRVEGPHANRFAGRVVPVTRKDNSETNEALEQLVWSGKDADTGVPVALYYFTPQAKKEDIDELPF